MCVSVCVRYDVVYSKKWRKKNIYTRALGDENDPKPAVGAAVVTHDE